MIEQESETGLEFNTPSSPNSFGNIINAGIKKICLEIYVAI